MKLILLEDVKSLGKKGDMVNVSDGYARNMLIPQKKAIEATAKNINDLKLKRAHDDKVARENLEAARALAEQIAQKEIKLALKIGDGGKAFGSVSSKEMADAAKSQLGIDIDKKKIQLDSPIREMGTVEVPVKLHPSVTAMLKVTIESEE